MCELAKIYFYVKEISLVQSPTKWRKSSKHACSTIRFVVMIARTHLRMQMSLAPLKSSAFLLRKVQTKWERNETKKMKTPDKPAMVAAGEGNG